METNAQNSRPEDVLAFTNMLQQRVIISFCNIVWSIWNISVNFLAIYMSLWSMDSIKELLFKEPPLERFSFYEMYDLSSYAWCLVSYYLYKLCSDSWLMLKNLILLIDALHSVNISTPQAFPFKKIIIIWIAFLISFIFLKFTNSESETSSKIFLL